MTDLHEKIMNLPGTCGLSEIGTTHGEQLAYKRGHRDARHAAAEMALESDAEIDSLRTQLAEAQAEAGQWKVQVWELARVLNCLPSTYVDGNAHVQRAAERLQAASTIKLAHDVEPFKVAELLRRIIASEAASYQRCRFKKQPFWGAVRDITALGSNCSAGLAKWAGFDPDTGAAISAMGSDIPKET